MSSNIPNGYSRPAVPIGIVDSDADSTISNKLPFGTVVESVDKNERVLVRD